MVYLSLLFLHYEVVRFVFNFHKNSKVVLLLILEYKDQCASASWRHSRWNVYNESMTMADCLKWHFLSKSRSGYILSKLLHCNYCPLRWNDYIERLYIMLSIESIMFYYKLCTSITCTIAKLFYVCFTSVTSQLSPHFCLLTTWNLNEMK